MESFLTASKSGNPSNSNSHHTSELEHVHPKIDESLRQSTWSNPAPNTVPSDSSPDEPRIESADTVVKEIQEDKREAQHVIATYGIDPVELLHMGKRVLSMMDYNEYPVEVLPQELTLIKHFCSELQVSHIA